METGQKRTIYAGGQARGISLTWHEPLLVALFPRAGLLVKIAVAAAAVLALWGMSKVSFFLPGNPTVPVTLQTMGVVLVGGALGLRWALITTLAYYGIGLAGVPLFVGESAGVDYASGATGGYLLGFILAAGAAGLLSQLGATHWRSLWAVLIGSLLVYLPGLVWLSFFVDADAVLVRGFYPFLVGDFLKITASGLILGLAWRIADRQKNKHEAAGHGE